MLTSTDGGFPSWSITIMQGVQRRKERQEKKPSPTLLIIIHPIVDGITH
jgi:hypothetical protein